MNRVSQSKFWLTLFSLVQGFCMSRHPQPHQSHLSPVLHMYPLLHHLEPPAVQWIYCSFFLTLLGFWAYNILFCSNTYLYHLTPTTTTTTLNLAQSSLFVRSLAILNILQKALVDYHQDRCCFSELPCSHSMTLIALVMLYQNCLFLDLFLNTDILEGRDHVLSQSIIPDPKIGLDQNKYSKSLLWTKEWSLLFWFSTLLRLHGIL